MILYIGFCVFKGLVDIFDRGVYVITLSKKHIYWPTGMYVYKINPHCVKKSDHDCLSVNCKGSECDVFSVKEPN